MNNPAIILVTGHPGTGKTSLAETLAQELSLPLTCKDQIKETLLDTLGWSSEAWAEQLSVASWRLLYQQIERLLSAGVDQMVEANFDPKYANAKWASLRERFRFRLLQIRCEASPEVLMTRYRERIANGTRHPGHIDRSEETGFLDVISQGPMGWVDVESERLAVDTDVLDKEKVRMVAEAARRFLGQPDLR